MCGNARARAAGFATMLRHAAPNFLRARCPDEEQRTMMTSTKMAGALAGLLFAASSGMAQSVTRGAEESSAVFSAHLPSLRGAMAQTEGIGAEHRVRELKKIPLVDAPGLSNDPVVQARTATPAAATAGLGFDGIGQGMAGYTVQYAPPDTTGAVGATQYVQWVNVSFAVFDKASGAKVLGPVAGNTLFAHLGGACATRNDGDPVVQYDKAAGRWVLSQFAVQGGAAGYWQCVAVSQTSDATGGYYLYAFPQPQFNDYPKMGVWPDGYYVTFNMFTSTFQGARVCALDRAKMLAGQGATQQCFQLSSSYGGLLPADLDGATAPPAGSPNYVLTRLSGSSSLGMWRFHTDWTNPANSTLTGPISIPVAAYNAACGGGTCVPQPNTNQKLDSLADRLMFRLAYRNINGVERMVVNHAVQVNNSNKPGSGNAAVRWYEIRNMSGTPQVYQQSSYSPSTSFRWMGSVAMDKQGNMAVGFSESSSTLTPQLAFATRLASDPLSTLGAESVIVAGGGSQLSNLSRWGDYTHMSIDPVDDCTFWYTGQYLKSSGTFNWSTRIASFKINGCQ
jgi:hypothetical protein